METIEIAMFLPGSRNKERGQTRGREFKLVCFLIAVVGLSVFTPVGKSFLTVYGTVATNLEHLQWRSQ